MKRIINLILVFSSLIAGASAHAQPATRVDSLAARLDSLAARNAFLEKVVGVQDALLTNAELRARGRPTELIAGNYNHSYRILQFGDAFADVANRFASLPTSGTVVLPPPSPAPAPAPAPPPGPQPASCSNCFAPLSSASQAEVVAALRRSIHFDWQTPWVNRIERELAAGVYSIVDSSLVFVVNFMIFGGMTAADNAIVERYRQIVDQRIPGTDTLYPAGDPRIRRVSGSPVTTLPPPAPSTTPTPSLSGDLVHIGGTASSITNEQAFGQTMLSVSAGGASVGGTATILMTARSPFSSTLMHQNGGDAGWRLFWNYRPCGPDSLCPADPNLGQIAVMIERDGSYSWTYVKPQTAAAGPFDGRPGKSFGIYPGGFNTAALGPYADIYGGQAGRGMRLGVTVTGANNPTWMVQLSPDGRSIQVMVDGVMRTLKACGSQVCF